MKKDRGGLLTFFILIGALAILQTAVILITGDLSKLTYVYEEVPSWYTTYAWFGLAVGGAASWGLWNMKKWGAYLIAFNTIVTILSPIFILKTVPIYTLMLEISGILGGIMWAWMIYRKWEVFD